MLNLFEMSERSYWKRLTLVYSIVFGLMLTYPSTFFWDDWLVYDFKDRQSFINSELMSGFAPWRAHFESLLLEFGPGAFRLVSFVSLFLSAVALNRTLIFLKYLKEPEIKIITCLYLFLPLFSVRVAMCLTHYSVCTALFFLASYILITKSSYVWMIISTILFILSFGTASLLVFSALPLLIKLNTLRQSQQKSINSGVIGVVLLAISVPSYWFINRKFNPSRIVALSTYYTPNAIGTLKALALGILLVLSLFVLYRLNKSLYSRNLKLLSFGFFALWCGSAPYMSLGHIPTLYEWIILSVPNAGDWNGRHQLLMPLGFSFILLAAFNWISNGQPKKPATAVVLISIFLSFSYSYEFYLDSLKQNELIAVIKSSSVLSGASYVMVEDQTEQLNARGRKFRDYEWEAILNDASNSQQEIKALPLERISCSDFPTDFVLRITSTHGRIHALFTRRFGIQIEIDETTKCKN